MTCFHYVCIHICYQISVILYTEKKLAASICILHSLFIKHEVMRFSYGWTIINLGLLIFNYCSKYFTGNSFNMLLFGNAKYLLSYSIIDLLVFSSVWCNPIDVSSEIRNLRSEIRRYKIAISMAVIFDKIIIMACTLR